MLRRPVCFLISAGPFDGLIKEGRLTVDGEVLKLAQVFEGQRYPRQCDEPEQLVA